MNYNEFLKEIEPKIFLTDSPTGYSKNIDDVITKILNDMGYTNIKKTNKGNLLLEIEGINNNKTVATSAHADTLGLMVRSINSDGTLKVTNVGGPQAPTLDGEYCKIITRDNKTYTGTVLSSSPSSHVYPDAKSKPRDFDNLIVRIDENVKSKEDVIKLGIDNGDYICYDPKTIITESGFLKSRFIDDKGSVCAILAVLNKLKEENKKPLYKTLVYFVNQEEVGHGASTVSDEIDEFVTVDMGCIGLDLAGNEYAVSIAAKDSNGPYDYELTTRLINLAKKHKLNYVVDIFPFYGSDCGAALHSGLDAKVGLIGPGVQSSHGMERTHLKAIENTIDLVSIYLFGNKLN